MKHAASPDNGGARVHVPDRASALRPARDTNAGGRGASGVPTTAQALTKKIEQDLSNLRAAIDREEPIEPAGKKVDKGTSAFDMVRVIEERVSMSMLLVGGTCALSCWLESRAEDTHPCRRLRADLR